MKKYLLSFLVMFNLCHSLMAAEPYVLLTGKTNNKTLSFYYGLKPGSALDLEDVYSWEGERAWDSDTLNIKKVVFDPSFASYRPTSTCVWFYNMQNLISIEGIEYLNTSDVNDMRWMFWGCHALDSLDVSHFITDKVLLMNSLFCGCSSLRSLDVSHFNTSNVTDMSYMFYNCSNLKTLDVSHFNTSNVTNMGWMFCGCSGLTSLDVTGFDTQNVEIMTSMFYNCGNLKTLDVSHFNTSNVTNMGWMFCGCSGLISLDVTGFDTRNVEIMTCMFYNCSNLPTLDVSHFKTNQVTDMSYMFYKCNNLKTLDVSHFNTSKVTNMCRLFSNSTALTSLDVSSFDTRNVKDMTSMFDNCIKLKTLDVSHFNTSNVENMSYMFYGCSSITSLVVSGFDTQKVQDMSCMFYSCSKITSLDVSGFDTQYVQDMSYMLANCSELKTFYVGEGWKTENVTISTDMFANCTNLVGENGTKYLANKVMKDYAVIDGGKNAPGYLTAKEGAYALLTVDDQDMQTLTFYYGDRPYDAYIVGTRYNSVTDRSWHSDRSRISIVVFDKSFSRCRPIHTAYWFHACTKLIEIQGLENLITSGVTDFSNMFYRCSSLTSLDLSGFNTSNVQEMNKMFQMCSSLKTIYVGNGWNMSNVINHNDMFTGCTNLVGGAGSIYDENLTDGLYARIDGGPESPGYFTNENERAVDTFVTKGLIFKKTSQATEKAVTYVKGSSAEQRIVPSSITYSGETYSVTAIADSAFAGQPQLKSVRIPSSVKAAGKNLFAESPHVAAITWEAPMKMTRDMAGSVVNNPNLLFYTSNMAYAPDGVTNVINLQTKQAKRIVLTDDGDNNDFYCPEEFTADEITYTHSYWQETVTGQCQGWESLALPFDVTEIIHETKGVITPFGALQIGHEFDNGTRPFWLYEYTTGGSFVEADGIKANVPYILSMPNENGISDEYILAGNITFKGTNVTVKATSGAKVVKSGNYSFTPSYKNGTSETVYLLNVDQNYDGNQKGSVFVKNDLLERQARPFEAYFQLNGSAGVKSFIGIFDEMTDDIRSMEPAKRNGNAVYYQLDGTKRNKLQRGFNIIRTPDGKIKKLMTL